MSKIAYRVLLGMYPPDHRKWFGEEMLGVFETAATEHRGWSYIRFLLHELASVAGGAAIAWAVKLSGRGYVHASQPVASATCTVSLPHEVQEAQDRLNRSLNGMLHAISHHQFLQARALAAEEQKAREELRRLREQYHIVEPET